MGQYDVLEVLQERKGEWLSAADIKKILGTNSTSNAVNMSLKKLKDSKMIKYKFVKAEKNVPRYNNRCILYTV